MSRVKTLALAAMVLFALAGCAQLFEFNAFGSLDNPPTPTAADYEGAGGRDKLAEDLNSPAMIDALIASGIVDDIAAELLAFIGASVGDDEDAEAAILYADLALKTSEGEELVNNIVDALTDGSLASSSDIATLLASIIPPEALASEAIFRDMVEALIAANNAYEQLGLYVDGDNDGLWDNPLPPGSLPGDVAQKAIVSYTMTALVQAVVTDPDMAPITEADAITQLYLVASNQAHDPDMDDIALDPFAAPDNWLLALLDLAGVAVP
jgi:hypothetical protein